MIQTLDAEQLKAAIHLKIESWTEELSGLLDNDLDFDQEYSFWKNWMLSGAENQDHRLLIGYFHQENEDAPVKLVGAAFASFADESDAIENAIELNGLWVSKAHRGKYISHKLLSEIIATYQKLGYDYMLAYNVAVSPSNSFYRHLNMNVIRQEQQMKGRLPVDIFLGDMKDMLTHLKA